jgi:putative nucleotidyltransferase with HDIG domain
MPIPDLRRTNRGKMLPTLTVAGLAAGLVGAGWATEAALRRRHSGHLHRAMVQTLLNALGSGDAFTARHSRRVADLACCLAGSHGLPRRRRRVLRIAALLHDMGKIDDRFFDIVHSPERLGRAERERIKAHPHESAHILAPLEEFHPGIVRIVESHHECWGGGGYPRSLRGEAIPLEARIISLADVFDALTQWRSYHEPRSVEDAFATLREEAGTRFDPELLDTLERPGVRRRWVEIARAGQAEEKRLAEEGRDT